MAARNKLKAQLSNEYSTLEKKLEETKLSEVESNRFKILEKELRQNLAVRGNKN